MQENETWATPTLKEAPFWRDDMTEQEYDIERKYFLQKISVLREHYVPLWKQ